MTATEELKSKLDALPEAKRERVAHILLDTLLYETHSGDGESASDQPKKSGFAAIEHLIGSLSSGVSDLGSNKSYLDDFGQSSMS